MDRQSRRQRGWRRSRNRTPRSKGTHALKIDNLQAIAKVFGLKAWQLLIPDLEPGNPPMLKQVSETEAKLYEDLQKLAAQITQATKQ